MSDEDSQKEQQEQAPNSDESKPKTDWRKLALDIAKGTGKVAAEVGKGALQLAGEAVKAIDVEIEKATRLSRREGVLETSAPATELMEAILYQLKTLMPLNRRTWWQSVNAIPEYMQIICEARWTDELRNPALNFSHQVETSVQLNMQFEDIPSGSRLKFNYVVHSRAADESYAGDTIKGTNQVLINVCERYPVKNTDASS